MTPSVKSSTKAKSRAKSRSTASKTASKAKGKGKVIQFLHKPNCTTCRKARSYMEKRGYQLYFRDLAKERLTPEELENLIGNHDHKEFLNTRNALYRDNNMKDNPPSRKEAIKMMSQEPNLIRRPVIVGGGRVVLGFDKDGIARI
jgi:Spx/MgsR family transcriptional regulator